VELPGKAWLALAPTIGSVELQAALQEDSGLSSAELVFGPLHALPCQSKEDHHFFEYHFLQRMRGEVGVLLARDCSKGIQALPEKAEELMSLHHLEENDVMAVAAVDADQVSSTTGDDDYTAAVQKTGRKKQPKKKCQKEKQQEECVAFGKLGRQGTTPSSRPSVSCSERAVAASSIGSLGAPLWRHRRHRSFSCACWLSLTTQIPHPEGGPRLVSSE
jgi:hypothetical protein